MKKTIAFLAAASVAAALFPIAPAKDAKLVQTVEVAYGKVCRYERADGTAYALSFGKDGELLSALPYRASTSSSSPSSFTEEKEQTDVYGNKVKVPTEVSDGIYTLGDPLRNIYVYHAHNGTGQFLTDDLRYRNETGVFSEPIAITSYLNLINVYDFYANGGAGVILRGADGSHDTVAGNAKEKGESEIRLLIHYGVNEQNAHGWFDDSYNAAFVGVGDGRADGYFYQLGRAADIMAHEYQHTITHFNVDFFQMNESGAIDEAISDIFGALAEGHELTDEKFWAMGEDAAAEKVGGVRSMKDPQNGYASSFDDPFPSCTEKHDHNTAGCDFGGVHYNSTILTHAQYKMWEEMPSYFTRERIGALWYSLIPLLGERATFDDFKLAFLQSAENLGFEKRALSVIRKHLGLPPLEYTVTFLNADGTELYQTSVPEGGTAAYHGETPALPSTVQYDYAFDGWEGDLSDVDNDRTVKAKYKEVLRSYPVKYYSEGFLYQEAQTAYGEKVALPTPEREGYTFAGWYLDEGLSESAENKAVDGEVRLYAKWEKKSSLGIGGIVAIVAASLLLPALIVLLLLFLRKKKK